MLRALMLRKKINDAKKEIEALIAKDSDFETRAADIQKRTDDTAQAIEEAQTEEEKQVVEDAIASIEADKAALDYEKILSIKPDILLKRLRTIRRSLTSRVKFPRWKRNSKMSKISRELHRRLLHRQLRTQLHRLPKELISQKGT